MRPFLPQQLANLLLPNNRPDPIAHKAATKNNVAPANERGNKADTFERTLDKHLSADNTKKPQQNKASATTRNDPTPTEENVSAATVDNKNVKNSDTSEEVAPEFATISGIFAASPVLQTNPTAAQPQPVIGSEANPDKTAISQNQSINTNLLAQTIDVPTNTTSQTTEALVDTNTAPQAAAIVADTNTAPQAAAVGADTNTAPQTSAVVDKPTPLQQSSGLLAGALATLNTDANGKSLLDEAQKSSALELAKAKTADAESSENSVLQNSNKTTKKFSDLLQASTVYNNTNAQNASAGAATAATSPVIATPVNTEAIDPALSGDETSITTQNSHTTSTKLATATQGNQATNTTISSLALQISRKVDTGLSRFQIRMDPAELGRIDVKIEFSHDGRMTANLSVERPETLDLLLKDARALERALADAGLQADKGALKFSLKDQSDNSFANFQEESHPDQSQSGRTPTDNDETPPIAATIAAYRNLVSNIAVDIRI